MAASPPSESPTSVRYLVLSFLCTLALLLYIDRVCIGQAATSICEDLDLSNTQMGWIHMAFSLAYCLFEVPTGHWGDRFGSRGVVTRIVLWWSAFTALTGAGLGLWSLISIRFLFGAGEAGALPNAARVVTRWFPPAERGRARGAIATMMLLGATVSPVAAAYLIGVVGWRCTFLIFGGLGVAWAALFYAWFRDDPAEHAAVNAAELRVIGTNSVPPDAPDAPGHIPWRIVLTSPNVWLLSTIMTVGSILFYMQFQWYPTYLKQARGLNEQESGWLTSAVMAAGAAGSVVGGLLADVILKRTRERKWSRRLCGGVALLLSCLSVAAVASNNSAVIATVWNAAALFFLQLAIPAWWTAVAEISGKHGAAMWGLMNSLGAPLGMAATVLVGWVVDARKRAGFTPLDRWEPVFYGVALALAVGAVCWLLVDATRSVVE